MGRIVDSVDPVVDLATPARTPTNNTSKSTHIKVRGIGVEDSIAYPTKYVTNPSINLRLGYTTLEQPLIL